MNNGRIINSSLCVCRCRVTCLLCDKTDRPLFSHLFVDPGKFETAWHRTDGRRVDLAPSPLLSFFLFLEKWGQIIVVINEENRKKKNIQKRIKKDFSSSPRYLSECNFLVPFHRRAFIAQVE